MGGGASSKKYKEEPPTPQITVVEKKPTLTLEQLARGERTHNSCTECGAPIKSGCNVSLCAECSRKLPRASSKTRAPAQDEDTAHPPGRRGSKNGVREESGSRRSSKNHVAVEDLSHSHSRNSSKEQVPSRRGSKMGTKGLEDGSSTTAESSSRRQSKNHATDPSKGHAMDPPPFAELTLPSAGPSAGATQEGRRPSHQTTEGGERHGERRKSHNQQHRSSKIGAYAGPVDMGIYKVGDRVIGDGKVGAEMGIGTIVAPGNHPGTVKIKFDTKGDEWEIKTEHLKPPLTPALEESFKRKGPHHRRPSIGH